MSSRPMSPMLTGTGRFSAWGWKLKHLEEIAVKTRN